MTTPIPYDDLAPDMWVTIRDHPEQEEPMPFGDPFIEAMRMRHQRRRPVPQPGTPMRVLAVDLPFLYLALMNADGVETGPLMLDLREQAVVGLDESVAHALRGFGWRKWQDRHSRREREARQEGEVEAATEVARVSHLRAEGIEDPEEEHDADRRTSWHRFDARVRRLLQEERETRNELLGADPGDEDETDDE